MKINNLYETFTSWTMGTMVKIYRENESYDSELSFELLYHGRYSYEAIKWYGDETVKWFDIISHKYLKNTYPESWIERKEIYIVI